MKTFYRILSVALIFVLAVSCDQIGSEQPPVVCPVNGTGSRTLKVQKYSWVQTKSVRIDDELLWSVGDIVTVLDENGRNMDFTVKESAEGAAILSSPVDSLYYGRKYKVIYPQSSREGANYRLFMTFGIYSMEGDPYSEDTFPKDWLYSDWTVFQPGDDFKFDLHRVNSFVTVEFTAPADMDLARAFISTPDQLMTIKGSFTFAGPSYEPVCPTDVFDFDFPLTQSVAHMKAGESYSVTLSMIPKDFKNGETFFHVVSKDNEEFYAPLALEGLAPGEVRTISVSDFVKVQDRVVISDCVRKTFKDPVTWVRTYNYSFNVSIPSDFGDCYVVLIHYTPLSEDGAGFNSLCLYVNFSGKDFKDNSYLRDFIMHGFEKPVLVHAGQQSFDLNSDDPDARVLVFRRADSLITYLTPDDFYQWSGEFETQ